MGYLRNNQKYAKMFAAVEIKSVIELKEAFMLLQLIAPSAERTLSMAVVIEHLEALVSMDEINAFLDAIDSLEAA